MGIILIPEKLNNFVEAFTLTDMCTFQHEPFFFIGEGEGGGGGEYRGYFTIHALWTPSLFS